MKWLTVFLCLFIFSKAHALKKELPLFLKRAGLPINKHYYPRLEKGETISHAVVKSEKNNQTLKSSAFALHPKNCQFALKKLSRYEEYKNHISFIKKSRYSERAKKVYFYINHTLMPFPMSLRFKIPRITKAGDYHFVFDNGMLKDLKGDIIIRKTGSKCFMGTVVKWSGPKTRIPDLVFEIMAQTLAEKALTKLIRISRY